MKTGGRSGFRAGTAEVDIFGLSMNSTAATNRVMKAMLQMKKLDMEALRQAYEG